MQYLGGKTQLAKPLARYLESRRSPGQPYLEPFVGAANVLCEMSGQRTGSDVHDDLIALLRGVRDGWEPPYYVSEEEYYRAKAANDNEVDPRLRAFIGFGCSFGGKLWGGYARNSRGDNYAAQSAHSLIRKGRKLQNAKLLCIDYRHLEPEGHLIYCDPPYSGRTHYRETPRFDHDEFWETMRRWSRSNTVLISEYEAPPDFVSVWEQPANLRLANSSTQPVRLTRLFQHATN